MDDLILNTLGVVVGYGIFAMFGACHHEKSINEFTKS